MAHRFEITSQKGKEEMLRRIPVQSLQAFLLQEGVDPRAMSKERMVQEAMQLKIKFLLDLEMGE